VAKYGRSWRRNRGRAADIFVATFRARVYAACQRGWIDAWGRFDNGKLEQIPPVEFVEGRPKGWRDIRYEIEGTHRIFPPTGCPGSSGAPEPDAVVACSTASADDDAAPDSGTAPPVTPIDDLGDNEPQRLDPLPTRTRRRNKNEKQSDIARVIREMGWVKNGRVDQPSGTWKDLCQLVEKHPKWSRGKCIVKTLGRTIRAIEDGKL
jgi:hypothetical protein